MSTKLKRQLDKWKREAQTLSNHSSLSAVVLALNGDNPLLQDSEDRAALVRYVEAWNSSGRNPWKMARFLSPTDAKRFSLSSLERVWTWTLARIGRTPEADRTIAELEKRGVRVREDAGGAFWALSPTGENRDMAAMFAGMLLTNPLRGKLSDGPCQREQCNKWFIKRRPLQKCCSRRCGAIVTTAERVSEQREDAKKVKLKTVRAAHRQWRKSRSRMDWKTWVSQKTGLSTKFLTRNFTKDGRIKAATDAGFESVNEKRRKEQK
jgi:hypothetical protein